MTVINMRAAGRLLSLCIAATFLTWADAAAQGMTTGVVQGSVADVSGSPVSDALVTLIDVGTGSTRVRTTDVEGRFSFSQLAPGEYELLVENLGYFPLRLTSVPVRPGRRVSARVTIRPTTEVVATPEVLPFESGGLSGTQPQFGQWFPRSQLARQPYRGRELTETLRLSSSAGTRSGVEGLPAHMLGFALDGVPLRSARSNAASWASIAGTSLPLSSFEAGELATNAVDVERAGFAGPILNGYSRRGADKWQPSVLAQWTALASGDDLDDVERPTDAQGGFMIGGPIKRDTAHFLLGGEFRRYDTPFAAPWLSAGAAGAAIVTAAETQNIPLQPFVAPGIARQDVFSVFARTEWQLSERHRLEARASYGAAPRMDAPVEIGNFRSLGAEGTASTAALGAALLSEFNVNTSNELRLAFTADAADSEWTGPFATNRSLPFTDVVGSGISFGGSAGSLTDFSRRQLNVSDAFTIQRGRHQFKLGGSAGLGSIEQTRFFAAQPRVFFGGLSDFEALEGVLVQPLGSPGTVEFALSELAAFAQDTWRPADGLELVAGVRYESERLPTSDLQTDTEWERLTGINSAALPANVSKLSPRFAIKWDPDDEHVWIFGGAVGVYHNEADVNALAAAIASDGRSRILRRVGAVPGWAAALPTDTAGSLRALTLLPAGYQSPSSLRASAGVTRSLGMNTAAHLSANYRETRNLPRAVDLNRWPAPVAMEDNGRPIYGQLVQAGGLIAADPGSNRRFAGFDQVIGVNTDGVSTYQGITVMVERAEAAGAGFLASYTYSRTTDDWYGAGAFALDPQVAPVLGSALAGWEDGRSDFDVPHRAVVAADIPAPGGIRLAAIYRYESGLPFTPGTAEGIDLNGDGFFNDPAFINDQIAGTADLISEWGCLRSQVDGFAERNSCRAEAVQSLDLRLSAQLLRGAGRTLQVYVDALNVLQSDVGIVDAAVYRVDPAGQISTDTSGRLVLPLIANPEFGAVRHRAALPRLLRVGLQFNW